MKKKHVDQINNIDTRRGRFVRVAERRVNTLLNILDSLSMCSNRKNYEYSDADVRKMFGEIEKKLKEVKALYQNARGLKNRFSL